MKEYVFKLVIHEGSDEFWKSRPEPGDVLSAIEECLYDYGFHDDITEFDLIGYAEGEPIWN